MAPAIQSVAMVDGFDNDVKLSHDGMCNREGRDDRVTQLMKNLNSSTTASVSRAQ